jgi:hypothetical protein
MVLGSVDEEIKPMMRENEEEIEQMAETIATTTRAPIATATATATSAPVSIQVPATKAILTPVAHRTSVVSVNAPIDSDDDDIPLAVIMKSRGDTMQPKTATKTSTTTTATAATTAKETTIEHIVAETAIVQPQPILARSSLASLPPPAAEERLLESPSPVSSLSSSPAAVSGPIHLSSLSTLSSPSASAPFIPISSSSSSPSPSPSPSPSSSSSLSPSSSSSAAIARRPAPKRRHSELDVIQDAPSVALFAPTITYSKHEKVRVRWSQDQKFYRAEILETPQTMMDKGMGIGMGNGGRIRRAQQMYKVIELVVKLHISYVCLL